MSDMTNPGAMVDVSKEFVVEQPGKFRTEEVYWGYIIRATKGSGVAIYIAQTVTMFLGASFLAAALGLMILPATLSGSEADIFRFAAAIFFVAAAALLLWFASRGTDTELQIDTTLGEVREVVRNRAGKSTLLGRYGFDSIGGVFLDRRGAQGSVALMMRYRNTSQTLLVAVGSEEELQPLKDRLGRDLMVLGAC